MPFGAYRWLVESSQSHPFVEPAVRLLRAVDACPQKEGPVAQA